MAEAIIRHDLKVWRDYQFSLDSSVCPYVVRDIAVLLLFRNYHYTNNIHHWVADYSKYDYWDDYISIQWINNTLRNDDNRRWNDQYISIALAT